MTRFAIEYRRIGLLATCLGNERVRIDSDGRVFHARNMEECEEGQIWYNDWQEIGLLDVATMAQLRQTIEGNGLLSLPSKMVDETFEGGRREELHLMLDEGEFGFVMQNCEQGAFRATVKLLRGALAHAGLAESTW